MIAPHNTDHEDYTREALCKAGESLSAGWSAAQLATDVEGYRVAIELLDEASVQIHRARMGLAGLVNEEGS